MLQVTKIHILLQLSVWSLLKALDLVSFALDTKLSDAAKGYVMVLRLIVKLLISITAAAFLRILVISLHFEIKYNSCAVYISQIDPCLSMPPKRMGPLNFLSDARTWMMHKVCTFKSSFWAQLSMFLFHSFYFGLLLFHA